METTATPTLNYLTNGHGLTVWVDFQKVPAVDPSRGTVVWKYDALTNAITFDPFYVPEPGVQVAVEYDVPCF